MSARAMKTIDALFAQYGKKFVPLEIIAADFLGVTEPKTISRLAHRNELGGIKAFRLGSTKSPWLVDIEQLADVLDAKSRTKSS
ncbi:MAG: pyocin activator PrtN family protein [Methylobacter sp.]